jgi:ribosomal protein S18 acetylase RimI-like enzyme
MNWRLRPAGPDDAPALAELGWRTFIDTFGHLYPPEDKESFRAERFSLPRTRADLDEAGRRIMLAEAGGTLVGFADLGALTLPVTDPEAGALELHRLYVVESAKGSGLAQDLMRDALDHARSVGAPALYLGVFHANARAQAFYRRHGFQIVGAYHFKVGGTLDDERIMRLDLRPSAAAERRRAS